MKCIRILISPKAHINGEIKGTYPSMASCARELGLQASHISEVCSGKRKRHKGYVFVKENDND